MAEDALRELKQALLMRLQAAEFSAQDLALRKDLAALGARMIAEQAKANDKRADLQKLFEARADAEKSQILKYLEGLDPELVTKKTA